MGLHDRGLDDRLDRSSHNRDRKLARYRASDCESAIPRGAAVCLNYATRTAEAEAAAGKIAATGGRVITIQADVAGFRRGGANGGAR